MPQSRGHALELVGVAIENGDDQAAQGLVGDVFLGQSRELIEHRVAVVARTFHKIERLEAVRRVALVDEPQHLNLNLRAETVVLLEDAADLEELPLTPLLFADLKK